LIAAFIIAVVPPTAGLIRDYSSLTSVGGKGEAT